jgi:ABC-2 type transport system permease protein
LALGLQFAAAGFMFAAVGAVTAQLTTGAGGARGIAVGVLGAAFLLRVAGDVSGQAGGGLSWLSPIGWAHRIRPYGGERWWVLALPVALAVLLVVVAVALSARRDVGAGLLPPRSGPAAAPGLRSPLALAWRLHRGLLAGWTAATSPSPDQSQPVPPRSARQPPAARPLTRQVTVYGCGTGPAGPAVGSAWTVTA